MTIAWYIIPYKRDGWFITPEQAAIMTVALGIQVDPIPNRTVALNVDDPNFKRWREVEVLGNRAIVKVDAGAGRLTQYDAAYKRLPKSLLNDSLADLPAGVKQALRDEALDMGYTLQEINTRFPDGIGEHTLREALKFMASRRRKPRYDKTTDTILFDGPVQACEDVDALDRLVV